MDQLSIRFNMYQLYQSVGRDRYSNISAKGLSGEGYEGHYFGIQKSMSCQHSS